MRLGSLGPVELILIVLAIVLIFGASKLGDLGGALGKSIKEFKRESKVEDEPAETPARPVGTTTVVQEPAVVVTNGSETSRPVPVGDFRPPDTKAT